MHRPWTRRLVVPVAVATAAVAPLAACGQGLDGGKKRVYVALTYSGNDWQNEAANLALAIGRAPENKDKYAVEKIVSGGDVQKEISDIQSMIAAGAKLIVTFPASPTALDTVIGQACRQHVVVVTYDSAVHAPCAYNIASMTGAREGNSKAAFFGAQNAGRLVEMLHGKGNIFINHGASGSTADNVAVSSAKAVFARYPGIRIVDEYYGNWDAAQSQQLTAKALAAHPGVDGIWSEDGDTGVVKALQAAGKKIPVSGQGGNYFVQQLGRGWPGVASWSPPAQGGIAMKIGLTVLAKGPGAVPHNIEMPLPWVTTKTAKPCPHNVASDSCNFFNGVSDTFSVGIHDDRLLPEGTVQAATHGNGVTKITPLPAMKRYEQPADRRLYTRGGCDRGWVKGTTGIMVGSAAVRVPGCVRK
jgi:ribose transport system substrate-binding protein